MSSAERHSLSRISDKDEQLRKHLKARTNEQILVAYEQRFLQDRKNEQLVDAYRQEIVALEARLADPDYLARECEHIRANNPDATTTSVLDLANLTVSEYQWELKRAKRLVWAHDNYAVLKFDRATGIRYMSNPEGEPMESPEDLW